jgi:hypothetical protein
MIHHRNSIAILALVVMVYLSPLGESLSWQSELMIRSIISMCLALTALNLSRKPCAFVVAGCEIAALLYNVVVAVGYSLDVTVIDRFYEAVMSTLFTTEIAALLLGMVADELRRVQQNRQRDRYLNRVDQRNHNLGKGLS